MVLQRTKDYGPSKDKGLWSFETEIDFSILVFNILILNGLTDFALVQIVSIVQSYCLISITDVFI